MSSSNIGGQAVIEGVMMRHGQDVAVAVRKSDGEIEVGKSRYKSIIKKHKILGIPIVRGFVAFIESMITGIKTLMYSASFYEDDIEQEHGVTDKVVDDTFKSKGEGAVMGITVFISLIIAVAVFILLPYFLSSLIVKYSNITSTTLLALIEGVVKLLIFIGYLFLISRMKDIKRTFMYHGAEHKCINCIETGHDLTVSNVMEASKEHRRCGTSFIFIVLFISIVFFIFIRVDDFWLRLLIRVLLIPVISGVSYEVIQWTGRSGTKCAFYMSRPGMMFQKLTTKEPTPDMAEVAIASVEAVFDWKAYLAQEFGRIYEQPAEDEPAAAAMASAETSEETAAAGKASDTVTAEASEEEASNAAAAVPAEYAGSANRLAETQSPAEASQTEDHKIKTADSRTKEGAAVIEATETVEGETSVEKIYDSEIERLADAPYVIDDINIDDEKTDAPNPAVNTSKPEWTEA